MTSLEKLLYSKPPYLEKTDCVKLLCNAEADVNINNFENTPLIFATTYGHAECIEELVSVGADVNAKNSDKQNALIMATSKRTLIRVGKSERKIRFKKSESHEGCVKLLLELGVHVNNTDRYGRTALYCAMAEQNFNCAKLLLKANANIHLCDHDKIDWCAWWDSPSFNEECWEML